jgi:hypothetical protein
MKSFKEIAQDIVTRVEEDAPTNSVAVVLTWRQCCCITTQRYDTWRKKRTR